MNKRERWEQLVKERYGAELKEVEDIYGAMEIIFEEITGEPFDPQHELAEVYELLVRNVALNEEGTFLKAYEHGERWWAKA